MLEIMSALEDVNKKLSENGIDETINYVNDLVQISEDKVTIKYPITLTLTVTKEEFKTAGAKAMVESFHKALVNLAKEIIKEDKKQIKKNRRKK